MVLYLLSSVVGVVVIVLLVVHLTKAGANSGASAGSTPTTSAPAAGSATKYVFVAAPKAGPYALNAATKSLAKEAESAAAPVVAQIKARGAGLPGQATFAMYDLGSVTTPGASGFKAATFVGYAGTFKPAEVIKYEQTQLVSTRMVNPGPHGGEMMCGYNRSTGNDASECVWVTNSTFGQVEFVVGSTAAKYDGASSIALVVRKAVEVPAS